MVLTQATSARSLPGTSKIAAIKKLTKRVPRTRNKMSWNGFALYNYASLHQFTPEALPVQGNAVEHLIEFMVLY